jgi:hypothetical protein
MEWVGDLYVYLMGNLTPSFVSDVVKTLIGSFMGAGLAFYFAVRKDNLGKREQQKAAGNMATVTLTQLANDFLQTRYALLEFQQMLAKEQPHSPKWMTLKAMHAHFADVRFDLPSLVFLMEHDGGAQVVEKLITVEMKVHDFFGQLTEHAKANYEMQVKLSEAKLDPAVPRPLKELEDAAGYALVARVESFVGGLNDHVNRTEAAVRDAADALPKLLRQIFGKKGVIRVELPTQQRLKEMLA